MPMPSLEDITFKLFCMLVPIGVLGYEPAKVYCFYSLAHKVSWYRPAKPWCPPTHGYVTDTDNPSLYRLVTQEHLSEGRRALLVSDQALTWNQLKTLEETSFPDG